MTSDDSKSGSPAISEAHKGLLSLAIIIHLCCVLTVLASNFRRSAVLEKLVGLYAPYTQLLNFDPNGQAYYITLGRVVDDDAVLAVDLYPDGDSPLSGQTLIKSVTLPDGGSRWMESRRRYLALAKIVQANSPVEEEPTEYAQGVAMSIAKAVGRRLMDENGARRAVVRCVRRMSQPHNLDDLNPGFPRDNPQAPAYDVTVFTADIWIDDEGRTQGARRASRSELAPLRTEGQR